MGVTALVRDHNQSVFRCFSVRICSCFREATHRFEACVQARTPRNVGGSVQGNPVGEDHHQQCENLTSAGCMFLTVPELGFPLLKKSPNDLLAQVMLTERMDESLMILRSLLGWHMIDVTYASLNATRAGARRYDGKPLIDRPDFCHLSEEVRLLRDLPVCLFFLFLLTCMGSIYSLSTLRNVFTKLVCFKSCATKDFVYDTWSTCIGSVVGTHLRNDRPTYQTGFRGRLRWYRRTTRYVCQRPSRAHAGRGQRVSPTSALLFISLGLLVQVLMPLLVLVASDVWWGMVGGNSTCF